MTGFPPGVVNGTIHRNDAVAAQAQAVLTTAYNDADGQASDKTFDPETAPAELGGLTLAPGVYTAPSSAQLTGTLTLDAQGDPNAVFIFHIGSTLTTASDSEVLLISGASPCNVFWQVASSATLGTNTTFVGTIMALTSVTLSTGASIDGRALARNGAVTLDTNRITTPESSDGGGTDAGVAGASSRGYIVPNGHPRTGAGGTASGTGPVSRVLLTLGVLAGAGADAAVDDGCWRGPSQASVAAHARQALCGASPKSTASLRGCGLAGACCSLIAFGLHEDVSSADSPLAPEATVAEAPVGTHPPQATAPATDPKAEANATHTPVSLSISAIGVAVDITSLALNSDETVEDPQDPADAGWYSNGPKAGENGSAVILGHVDSMTGPGVFHRLESISTRDRIAVTLSDGRSLTTGSPRLPSTRTKTFPVRKVYAGSPDRPALHLVT